MNNQTLTPASNLVCLRDPECKTHAYHAGHITFISQDDPRELFQFRQKRRLAGAKASQMVRHWEKSRLGPNLKMDSWQRHTLITDLINTLNE